MVRSQDFLKDCDHSREFLFYASSFSWSGISKPNEEAGGFNIQREDLMDSSVQDYAQRWKDLQRRAEALPTLICI